MKKISFGEFKKVVVSAGTVLEAKEFKEAINPAYILRIDFGDDIGILKSSAQITGLYEISSLIGKKILAVVNLNAKQVGPIMSECLVVGFYNQDGKVVLAVPDKEIP